MRDRVEAKLLFDIELNGDETVFHIWKKLYKIMDMIYDDFAVREKELQDRINKLELQSMDSRTCGNCNVKGCEIYYSLIGIIPNSEISYFSCNKHQAKEN